MIGTLTIKDYMAIAFASEGEEQGKPTRNEAGSTP